MSKIKRFSSAATAADAAVHVVNRAKATAQLANLLEHPAVGVPLSIDGILLPDKVDTAPDEAAPKTAKTGITDVLLGIEPLGSIVVPADEWGTGSLSLFAERQVVVVERDDLSFVMLPAYSPALNLIEERWRQLQSALSNRFLTRFLSLQQRLIPLLIYPLFLK